MEGNFHRVERPPGSGLCVSASSITTNVITMNGNKKYILALLILISSPLFLYADVSVDSYYRSDPDSNPYNNYSFPGNVNPNTGKVAPGNPNTYISNYYRIKSGSTGFNKQSNGYNLQKTFESFPPPDNSNQLLKAQQDFQKQIEQEKQALENKIYQLQLQNVGTITGQCIYPSTIGCTTERQYSNTRATDGATGLLGTDISNNRLDECRSQIDTYQQKLTQYNQCISNAQNQAINSIADKAVELANLKKQDDYYISLLAQKQQEILALSTLSSHTDMCQSSHGKYSYFNKTSDLCECQDGFAPDDTSSYQCIPLVIWCKVEVGVGALNKVDKYIDGSYRNEMCGCDIGYQWNSDQTQCVKKTGSDTIKTVPKKTFTLMEIKARTISIPRSATTFTQTVINTPSFSTSSQQTQKQTIAQKLQGWLSKLWK